VYLSRTKFAYYLSTFFQLNAKTITIYYHVTIQASCNHANWQ